MTPRLILDDNSPGCIGPIGFAEMRVDSEDATFIIDWELPHPWPAQQAGLVFEAKTTRGNVCVFSMPSGQFHFQHIVAHNEIVTSKSYFSPAVIGARHSIVRFGITLNDSEFFDVYINALAVVRSGVQVEDGTPITLVNRECPSGSAELQVSDMEAAFRNIALRRDMRIKAGIQEEKFQEIMWLLRERLGVLDRQLEHLKSGKSSALIELAGSLRYLFTGKDKGFVQMAASFRGVPLPVFISALPALDSAQADLLIGRAEAEFVGPFSSVPVGDLCRAVDLDVWLASDAFVLSGQVVPHFRVIREVADKLQAHYDLHDHKVLKRLAFDTIEGEIRFGVLNSVLVRYGELALMLGRRILNE